MRKTEINCGKLNQRKLIFCVYEAHERGKIVDVVLLLLMLRHC